MSDECVENEWRFLRQLWESLSLNGRERVLDGCKTVFEKELGTRLSVPLHRPIGVPCMTCKRHHPECAAPRGVLCHYDVPEFKPDHAMTQRLQRIETFLESLGLSHQFKRWKTPQHVCQMMNCYEPVYPDQTFCAAHKKEKQP